jgi:ribonuclease-3
LSDQLADFQKSLDVTFQDWTLLLRALTHRSFVNEHPDSEDQDNERLEFLGDSILDFVVSEWLYQRFPDVTEGKLTRLRAGLVRTESLGELAREAGVGAMLRLGRGEEDNGGRERVNNLCGAFEAINGALYLDSGLEAVRTFAIPRFEPRLAVILREESDKDAKSRLQEWSQSMLNLTPSYKVREISGPEHDRHFTIDVLIGEAIYGTGHGHSKRIAEQQAAQLALDTLTDEGDEDYNP